MRPGGNGPLVAGWASAELERRDDVQVTVADLATLGLTLDGEPENAKLRNPYVREETETWSRLVSDADGFVFVFPEYNRSMPASLKNALDSLYWEWHYKPVGFVSYSGGAAGGVRSVEMIKQVTTSLKMFPADSAVNIGGIASLIEGGQFDPPNGAALALEAMFDEVVDLCRGTRALRAV